VVGPRLLIAGLNSLFVFGLFVLGFAYAREAAAIFLGLGAGLASATFWALASVFAEPEHNLRLNLYAAWSAAGSLGFLSPAQTICAAHHLPLVCQ
jgi:drug/metabolite transporter (DMT)-like permease